MSEQLLSAITRFLDIEKETHAHLTRTLNAIGNEAAKLREKIQAAPPMAPRPEVKAAVMTRKPRYQVGQMPTRRALQVTFNDSGVYFATMKIWDERKNRYITAKDADGRSISAPVGDLSQLMTIVDSVLPSV